MSFHKGKFVIFSYSASRTYERQLRDFFYLDLIFYISGAGTNKNTSVSSVTSNRFRDSKYERAFTNICTVYMMTRNTENLYRREVILL